jgi:serine phosphatase RsbU (regulator of sigma subunit)/anti-sigma regulatory factor (Ser/Thr protein kinase)
MTDPQWGHGMALSAITVDEFFDVITNNAASRIINIMIDNPVDSIGPKNSLMIKNIPAAIPSDMKEIFNSLNFIALFYPLLWFLSKTRNPKSCLNRGLNLEFLNNKMETILIYIASILTLAVLAFTAGFLSGSRSLRNSAKLERILIKTEELSVLAFKNDLTPQFVEKTVLSMLGHLHSGGFISAVILRFEGSFLTNIKNNVIVNDEQIKNRLLNIEEASGIVKDRELQSLIDSRDRKHNYSRVVVYPYVPGINGVKYYAVFFIRENFSVKALRDKLSFLSGHFNILLFFREFLFEFNEIKEFHNRLFIKNPVSLCVTDREGTIIRHNESFTVFSNSGLLGITQIIDKATFTRVIDGHTLEIDSFYSNKNIKLYGMPLHGSNGIIKGGIFILLDESLQYLLLKKLEASEERYKKFLKELPIGLAIINQEGIIYFVNDNFISSIGFSEADRFQGDPIQNYFDIPQGGDFREITNNIPEQDFLLLKLNLRNDPGKRIFSAHLQKIILGNVELIEATFQDISLENKLYAQLAEKTKMIEEELATARRIWNHVLTIPPVYSSLVRFETFFKPSSQLGGDFCDIIQIDDYHIGVIMADVSGHGVSASLLTSMLKMLVEYSQKEGQKLEDIVNYLNLALLKILPDDQFITLFYGIINLTDYTLEYINCGHPFPFVYNVKTNEQTTLMGVTYPLGVRKNVPFDNARMKVALPENCKILLFTDGILAFRNGNRMMRVDDLTGIFSESLRLRTRNILNNIYMTMLKTSTQFVDDDVSMLLIILNKDLKYKKFLSIPSNILEIDTAILKISENINKVITLSDEENWKIYTALYETMINAVEHGNKSGSQKRVTVIYRILINWIVMKVRDEGIGFDFNSLPSPLDDENLLKPSGRGVYITKKVMDKIRYNSIGNEITMFMKLQGPARKGE